MQAADGERVQPRHRRRRIARAALSAALVGVLAPLATAGAAVPTCTISGTPGADVLVGSPGPDVLCGRGGDDRLVGGGGDDVLLGASGDDVLQGGLGNDSLRGASGDDVLVGGTGADVLKGGTGRDEASYAGRTAPVEVDLDGLPDDGEAGEGDLVTLTVEGIRGGEAGDTLVGSAGVDHLAGGGGADTLDGAEGNDLLDGGPGADALTGGAGTDAVTYAQVDQPVTVRIDGQAGDGEAGENDRVDATVENVVGGSAGDTLEGSLSPNRLDGGRGNDRLNGSYGDDTLIGGLGHDDLSGGPGVDTVAGGAGTDLLVGGGGPDLLAGGAGADTVSYAASNSPVAADLDDLADDGPAGEDDRIRPSVEHLIGGSGDDVLVGNDDANDLDGLGGSDHLTGDGGDDRINGAAGDDTLTGGTGADELDGGWGFDECHAGGDAGDVVDPSCSDPVPLRMEHAFELVERGAWCWFQMPRMLFDRAAERLYASAVIGSRGGVTPDEGQTVLSELDLTSGTLWSSPLGWADFDDHNAAAIWESDAGEVVAVWTRHAIDQLFRVHRRSAPGTMEAQDPFDVGRKVTYANLMSVDTDEGTTLYNFYRAEGGDQWVMSSPDDGLTWTVEGRMLRDPDDDADERPYVVYAADADERIHLLATEAHPRSQLTSLYHGYIEDGIVHGSAGNVIGPIDGSHSVEELTQIWSQSGDERGWGSSMSFDPDTGAPVVAFSVRHSPADHRFWRAIWNGSSWEPTEIAYAGTALYENAPDYTGLVTLDPTDPTSLVMSTDVDPDTGEPLISAADGNQHHELYEGIAVEDGSVTWSPLTTHSSEENLRPVIAVADDGTRAIAWMQGVYPFYWLHRTDIMAVVQRPDGTFVEPPAPVTPS